MLEKVLQNINKFYQQDFKTPEQTQKMFELINEVVEFDFGAIFYLVPNELQLKFQTNNIFEKTYKIDDKLTEILYTPTIKDISSNLKNLFLLKNHLITTRLTIKGTVLGVLCLARKNKPYTQDEQIIIETYSNIIANIIKDIELAQILSQQTKTLEKGLKETHKAYETIKQQNKKIKENEKLQNQFLANISHDLRTPLNSIICLSEILSNKMFGDLNDKQLEYIEDIRISGIRLLGMINEVLDITKLESKTISLNKTNINLTILSNEVINILKPLYNKKNIKIACEIPKDITMIGDYIKLQQVLFNIIGNAIKFSPENSTIEIKITQSNKNIAISIKDYGIGISKTNQKKIFKKFYQVENTLSKSELSTGLGLTIAKEFVKLHKGKIEVSSEIQKGTTFTIKLPIMND